MARQAKTQSFHKSYVINKKTRRFLLSFVNVHPDILARTVRAPISKAQRGWGGGGGCESLLQNIGSFFITLS